MANHFFLLSLVAGVAIIGAFPLCLLWFRQEAHTVRLRAAIKFSVIFAMGISMPFLLGAIFMFFVSP